MTIPTLIVEDEPELAQLLADNLACEGFAPEIALDGRSGLERARAGGFQLILLDLMLPELSGIDVLRELRRESDVPVIILSARGQEADIVIGLELGADDYVPKPFGVRELTARARALLRRSEGRGRSGAGSPDRFSEGDVTIDFRTRQLSKGRQAHPLSHTESEILRFLIGRRGRPASRGEILDAVWGEDAYPTTRTVDNFILRLRAKLEDDPRNPRLLLTVHGIGYQYVDAPR